MKMDVYGNGVSTNNDDEIEPQQESYIHPHCDTCIKIWKCTVRPRSGQSCEIVGCDVDCGARFHACKRAEHRLLCANEKVPCINSVNGCPIWLLRGQQGAHLERCPASVVHCTMEWNRWPVCSRERQLHIPFHQPNPNAKAGQLDVALALRDQRMLNEWLRAPRRTRRALRNGLTRRFPAVPLQLRTGSSSANCGAVSAGADGGFEMNTSSSSSHPTSRTVTDDEEDTPWEVKKSPPGLQRSVCGELYRASKQATDSLTAALNVITGRNGHQQAGSKDAENRPHLWLSSEDKENMNGIANGWSAEEDLEKVLLHTPADVADGTETLDAEEEEAMDVEERSSGVDDEEAPGNYDVLFVDHTVVSEISSASMADHARKPSIPPIIPPPPTSPPLFVNLGLDLTLESITRYQAKPKSMYTFLCAQEFRRDEYSWHYQNVHSDIHGGLNGWLEQRCPLAHYGCMYSMRRFFPTCHGSVIVHNDILESFGVIPKPLYPVESSLSPRSSPDRRISTRHRSSPPSKEQKTPMSCCSSPSLPMNVIHEDSTTVGQGSALLLSDLPFEVLQYMARFLDGFSLCNLSMTSRLFREVCCSLLEYRGIVVQQWERVKNPGTRSGHSWRISYKRWFFSTAFTPIRQWGFEDKENMSNHLKSCIYFQRTYKTEPYFYPVGINPDPRIYQKLKDGIERSQKNEALVNGKQNGHQTTTKL